MMTAYKAAMILNHQEQARSPLEYLEAALFASIHGGQMKGLIDGNTWNTAKNLADYAVDHGEANAVKLIQETLDEAKPSANDA